MTKIKNTHSNNTKPMPYLPTISGCMHCNQEFCLTPTGRRKTFLKVGTYRQHMQLCHPELMYIFIDFDEKALLEKRCLEFVKGLNLNDFNKMESILKKLSTKHPNNYPFSPGTQSDDDKKDAPIKLVHTLYKIIDDDDDACLFYDDVDDWDYNIHNDIIHQFKKWNLVNK